MLFFGAGAFFCFFALGGVLERSESSCRESRSGAESSSSVSGFGRFFEATGLVLAVSVICVFFGAALGAAAFLFSAFGAALALGLAFYGLRISLGLKTSVGIRLASLTMTGSGEKTSESSLSLNADSTSESSMVALI